MEPLEESLKRDFPREYAVVEARLDPVLCGLANELYGGMKPLFATVVPAMVLEACRRYLAERHGGGDPESAAGFIFRESFGRLAVAVSTETAERIASGNTWAGIADQRFTTGFAYGLTTGVVGLLVPLGIGWWLVF